MCNCRYCRVTNLAYDAIEAAVEPTDPVVLEAVREILLFRADNAEAGARTALDFARADDRFAVELRDDDFAVRAAMFRGIAFRDRERGAELRLAAARWPQV